MKKITMKQSADCSVDKAFLDFQRVNVSKNLSQITIDTYDKDYKYFRKVF